MKTITKYIANDGKEFANELECLLHEDILKLENIYENNKLYGNYDGCRIEFSDLVEWINCNWDFVKKLMKNLNSER